MSTINFELFLEVNDWLATEAKLLDERRFWEWYELLADDLDYHVPLRQSKLSYPDELPANAWRIRDTKTHVSTRIKRMDSGAAWAETPPSRTLRSVGSVQVKPTGKADEFEVESALLLFRQRGHNEHGDVIPVRRTDLLRRVDGKLLLAKRYANVTEAVLMTPNLGVFL